MADWKDGYVRLFLIADLGLVLVQWLLIFWGAVSLWFAGVWALRFRAMEAVSGAPAAGDTYSINPLERAVYAVVPGLIAMGLGAVLFYLRGLYLRRRPSGA